MSSPSPVGVNINHAEKLAQIEGGWMLRGCLAYHQELVKCKSITGR